MTNKKYKRTYNIDLFIIDVIRAGRTPLRLRYGWKRIISRDRISSSSVHNSLSKLTVRHFDCPKDFYGVAVEYCQLKKKDWILINVNVNVQLTHFIPRSLRSWYRHIFQVEYECFCWKERSQWWFYFSSIFLFFQAQKPCFIVVQKDENARLLDSSLGSIGSIDLNKEVIEFK